jgi:hypothetical protein
MILRTLVPRTRPQAIDNRHALWYKYSQVEEQRLLAALNLSG